MANVDAFNSGFKSGMGKKDDSEKSLLLREPTPSKVANPSKFKKGGRVKRTGKALVHRGEYVLTAKQAKQYRKKNGKRKRVSGKR